MKALSTVRRAARILRLAWQQAARIDDESVPVPETANDEERRVMMIEVLEKALAAARDGKLSMASHLATHAFEVTDYAPFTPFGLKAFCKRVSDGGFPNEANLLLLAMDVLGASMSNEPMAMELLLAQTHNLVCDWLRKGFGDDEDEDDEEETTPAIEDAKLN